MQTQPVGLSFEYSIYELFLTENGIMILVTFLFSAILVALRDNLSARRKQLIWHEDALFMESFGKLYDDLNSESTKQLMDDYHQQEPHVTHFCFLVHGFNGFSKVS